MEISVKNRLTLRFRFPGGIGDVSILVTVELLSFLLNGVGVVVWPGACKLLLLLLLLPLPAEPAPRPRGFWNVKYLWNLRHEVNLDFRSLVYLTLIYSRESEILDTLFWYISMWPLYVCFNIASFRKHMLFTLIGSCTKS